MNSKIPNNEFTATIFPEYLSTPTEEENLEEGMLEQNLPIPTSPEMAQKAETVMEEIDWSAIPRFGFCILLLLATVVGGGYWFKTELFRPRFQPRRQK